MSEQLENPYLNARKTSNDKTADLIDRSRLWQAVALLALMLALAGVGGVIVFASRSQFIPYVIEVDKLGAAAAVRVADRAGNVDERVVRHLLASWIADMRTVTFAKEIQNENVWRIYSMLRRDDAATKKTTTYFSDDLTSPVARSDKFIVTPAIVSVLQTTNSAWEVNWTETTFIRDTGEQIGKANWRALIDVYFLPMTSATKEEDIRRNPLGLYIKDFSWAEQKQ